MRCSVFGCNIDNSAKCFDSEISFHTFPKDKKLCKYWVYLCRRKDVFNIKTARICSKHFKLDDFIIPNAIYLEYGLKVKSQLKRSSSPSLFLPLQKEGDLVTPRNVRSQKRDLQSSATVTNIYEADASLSDSPTTQIENDQADTTSGNFESIVVTMKDCATQTHVETKDQSQCTETDSNMVSYSQLQEVIHLRQKCLKQENVIKSISHIFTNGQLKKMECSEKRAKWEKDDIANAITIHASGPRAYRLLLKKKYPLPAVITLKKWCAKIKIYPGIIQCALNIMRKVDMTVTDKVCIISFDEMKIKEKIVYDKTKDETLKCAKYVQVAMVRGLYGSWKQPIYYDFDQRMTECILFEIVNSIQGCGFHVVAIVCDLGGTNQGLLRDLNITITTPYFQNPANESKKIYVFADVPHLIKLVRNNFVDHDGFEINGEVINKSIIEELMAKTNEKSDLSVAYKISATNLTVKGAERQKVKLATKLFSHTVSKAILRAGSLGELKSESWLKCAEFFKLVNDWFDCLNIRTAHKDSRQRVQAIGLSELIQFEIIEKMSANMLKMRVKGKSNMMPFQKGILMTNTSLKLLHDDLKSQYEMPYLLTYRLNQDVLENFFGVIRAKGGLYDHPDRLEFMYRLRSYILGRNEGSLSNDGNTMVDDTPDIDIVESLSSNVYTLREIVI